MILEQYLYLDGVDTPLINADIALGINRVGAAKFEIRSEQEPNKNAVIQFAMDYQPQPPLPYFTGYIKDIQRGGRGKWIISARELSHALNLPCHVSLRNCTLNDVLKDITKNTGLTLKSPQATNHAPRFQNHGDGLRVLELIPRLFKVDDCIWQLSADGQTLFIGSWKDSHWAGKEQTINPDLFDKESSGNRSTIAFIPRVRPGCVINDRRIKATRFVDDRLKITWEA